MLKIESNPMDTSGREENRDLPRNQEPNGPVPPAKPDASKGKDEIPPQPQPQLVYFRYLGQTAMTVVGPVTGTLYRFGRPGAIVAVDHRDAGTIAGISHLRLINQARGRWDKE